MCGIVGSLDKDKFAELMKLNSYRGNFSHSMTLVDIDTLEYKIYKDFGPFNYELIDLIGANHYILGHNQAPTGGLIKDRHRIHPAEINRNLMWHNGILKNKQFQKLKQKFNCEWDTKLFLEEILNTNFIDSINNIDGTFSCVLLQKNSIKVFRNSSCILYFDASLNISSAKYNGGSTVPYNKVFGFDLANKRINIVEEFNNVNEAFFY